ncbi:MAG: CsgE family curli-type amyloid fiber assembly protein [Paludibacter sp.]|nr:CsgE family curli-type amyloid fiber assembly protein [Paludibacter sp.]
MSLFASVFLSAFLMVPQTTRTDSIKMNPNAGAIYEKQVSNIVVEAASMKGVKVKYLTDPNNQNGVRVKLDFNIHFVPGDSALNNESKERLAKFAEILIKNPATAINIIGHTDNTSTLELNQTLSVRRARAVAGFLSSKNVQEIQLKEIIGKNYSEPIATNTTDAGRAANRRVDIYIVLSDLSKNSTGSLRIPKESLNRKHLPSNVKKLMDQVIQKPNSSYDVEIEIDGILVDDTKTKAGKEFYDQFYNNWEAPEAARNYSITISEKPFRLTTTMIVISINDDIVYQDILQPRQDLIESQKDDAISTTQNYLVNYEEIIKQLNGDDMAGTGIY